MAHRFLRRLLVLLLLGAGSGLVARDAAPMGAQDQAPGRHDFALVGRGFRWTPDRIEATQDDLVRLTIRSEDITYSFAIDEYRVARLKHFASLVPFAQQARKPIFDLKQADGIGGGQIQAVARARLEFQALVARLLERLGVAIPV